MYTVELAKNAEKSFFKLSKKDQQRVLSCLEGLEKDPFIGKKLHGPLAGLWSVRVYPYRVIYTIKKKEIIVPVVAIGDRKDVYKKL